MKKMLVVSSYAPPAIGGPQNIYNLFKDLPIDKYAFLTSFYNIDNRSAQTGSWLPGKYFFYDKPTGTREEASQSKEVGTGSRDALSRIKHLVKRSAIARTLLGPFIIFGQIFLIVSSGRKTIREFSASELMAVSDYGPAMIGTYLLNKITSKPYSLYLLDLYKGNFLAFPGGILADIFEEKIIKKAEKIIVTNEGTLDYYRKEYGEEVIKKFIVIHNAVVKDPYLPLITPYDPKPPYTILYTGRIYWPQIRSLKNLVKAVERITDLDIQIKIYCPNPPEYIESLGIKGSRVSFNVGSPQDMPAVQSKADILFLPLSWGTKSQKIIDTATPGKLSDYLISGRPMLIHAPASTFLVKYAKQNNFALVVDTEDITKIQEGIRKILRDVDYSKELVKNAQATFENHDAKKNATIFADKFFDISPTP